jgi:Predicted transcriptional regulator
MRRGLQQHERIKMRLRLAGTSLADVARELGVTSTTVTSVSQGLRRSRRIETLIAAKLQTTPQRLWPDRYPPVQKRVLPRSRRSAMT